MTPEAALSFLGLRPGATPSDIKRAYRRIAKEVHPDLFPDPGRKLEAEEQFKKLRAAVDALAAGYWVPVSGGGMPSRRAAPFDPRDIYGSTYAYSFARRNPIARSPLVGCLLAMSLPMGAGIVFETNGFAGLIRYLIAVSVVAMIVWLVRRAAIAIRQSFGGSRR